MTEPPIQKSFLWSGVAWAGTTEIASGASDAKSIIYERHILKKGEPNAKEDSVERKKVGQDVL